MTVKLFIANIVFVFIGIAAFGQVPYNLDRETAIKEPWKQALAAPKYQPIVVAGNMVSLMGKKLELDVNGFPKQITFFVDSNLKEVSEKPHNLLAENVHFHFVDKNGKTMKLAEKGITFKSKGPKTVRWKAEGSNDSLKVEVEGRLSWNGALAYAVKVRAKQPLALKDITMHIPFDKMQATYLSGLGQKAGPRPEKVEWRTDVSGNENACWIGNADGGLQYELLDAKSRGSWSNNGKGGITIGIKGSSMLANNFTGPWTLKRGEVRRYNFSILLTPLNLDFAR